tara:strand:- start:931 stop:1890 length:960 start_codon:yes stop_codon:yes gene_type:complete
MVEKSGVSVVIPTYNEEKSIEKLIELLSKQTYSIDEIIISDANSKDKTLEILKKYVELGHNIKFAKRNGFCRGSGRNAGINTAKNDLIALIDAGSYPEKDWIENLLNEYNSKDDIVFGCVKPIHNNLIQFSLSVLIVGKSSQEITISPTVSSMLINKKTWLKVGKFKESKNGDYIVEDLMFINEIKKSNKQIHYAKRAIVNWILPSNISKIFLRFLEYSSGGIKSGFYEIWHHGIIRNILILLILLILSYFNVFLILILPFLLLIRSYLYLKEKIIYKKMNLLDKVKSLLTLSFILTLVDLASIFGVFKWLFDYKKASE